MHIAKAAPPNLQAKKIDASEKLRDELEFIGYLISHDLQSPLRAIQACCEELIQLPTISPDTAQTLTQENERLKAMMQGMLEYIRLETFSTALMTLDCNEIAQAAIAALEGEIKTTGARVTMGTMPQVLGHRGRLTRLFAYLIDNALKFHSREPKVTISTSRAGDFWQFCVEDNGIGIDEQHHETIFRLFQRLHAQEAYPGYGIGLTLARKIVETYGGELWVESATGKGSRFYFTLPSVKEY